MPACTTTRLYRLTSLLLAPLAGFCMALSAAPVRAEAEQQPVEVIISKLPAPDTPAYRELKAHSLESGDQPLDMTHSEMWTIPADRIEALTNAAEKAGAEIMVLDADWNRVAKSMSADQSMTAEQKDMMQDSMEQKGAMGLHMLELPDARMVELALTKGMTERAYAPPAMLKLPLSKSLMITAERTSIEKTADGYIWRGTIAGTFEPVTLVWWPSGRLTGQVSYQGRIYTIKHMGGDMHCVIEMEPDALPPEHAPMDKSLMKKMNMKEDPLVTRGDAGMLKRAIPRPEPGDLKNLQDAPIEPLPFAPPREPITAPPHSTGPDASTGGDGVEIAVLVAFTRAAASHYTDVAKDLVALAIADANASFQNSRVGDVRLKLVHAYETDYVEKGSHFDHVFRFADKGDGELEEVHPLRDAHNADLAVLIVDDANGCGLAAGVAPPPDRAFAVVHHGCAATTYSLTHEIGHLLGARHDPGLDDSKEPFPFGHGFVNSKEWRTMMSYKESCDGCPRLPIWSNPEVRVRGVAAGDELSDNARVIRLQARKVSQYR